MTDSYKSSPFSRGTCHLQILKYQQAIADFKKVVKLEPKNDLVKTQLASTQKLVRKIEFEKVTVMPFTYLYVYANSVFRQSNSKGRKKQHNDVLRSSRKVNIIYSFLCTKKFKPAILQVVARSTNPTQALSSTSTGRWYIRHHTRIRQGYMIQWFKRWQIPPKTLRMGDCPRGPTPISTWWTRVWWSLLWRRV